MLRDRTPRWVRRSRGTAGSPRGGFRRPTRQQLVAASVALVLAVVALLGLARLKA
ncbi:MAG: hypothetical protein QOD96_5458, partial [Pseudonocardiales bacterium]|nr:hypothetical protein [Pseudonocardiales bacterium]